jgi:hypothetical protein
MNLGREVGGAWEARRDSPGHGRLLAWGYTVGLGNFDDYVVGATDLLTGNVMLWSCWSSSSCCLRGSGVRYGLLEDGDDRAMIQKVK